MLNTKTNFIRSKKHRQFVASHSCIICGATNVQCAHIESGGKGLKCCDSKTIPLCVECHDAYDGRRKPGRKRFVAGENKAGIKFDPARVAQRLALQSPVAEIFEVASAALKESAA